MIAIKRFNFYLGQKVNDISEKYFEDKKKRELMAELFRLVQIENSKRKKSFS